MFNKKELIDKYDGEKITKGYDWVKKYDPGKIEVFGDDFEEMVYYFSKKGFGLIYLPDGKETDPLYCDPLTELFLKDLRFLPDIEQKINNLKGNWTDDPCWDIEETDGFEPFKDELLEYSKEMEEKWKKKREKEDKKLEQKANELGLEGLYRLILKQEKEIEQLKEKIDRNLIV